jgi:8-oxo-dGTP pyrophosphatase MutT (NUDIX family)
MIDTYPDVLKKKRRRPKKSKRLFIIGKHSYVSAGIIFCRYINGIPHYLLIKRSDDSRFMFEDLGGKIDDEDEDLIDLAAREAAEECNAALVPRDLDEITKVRTLYDQALNDSINYIKALISVYGIQPLLFPQIKYAIYVIPLPDNMIMQDFGDVEIVHDVENNSPIKRTLNWYNEYQLRRINIRDFNPRIRVLVNTLFKGQNIQKN